MQDAFGIDEKRCPASVNTTPLPLRCKSRSRSSRSSALTWRLMAGCVKPMTPEARLKLPDSSDVNEELDLPQIHVLQVRAPL